MKIIQTFWTGQKFKVPKNSLSICAGWGSPEYHWMSWTLSCLQARLFFNEVELITDNLGKEILIDTFKLPYTKVSTILEGALDQYPTEAWALAKLLSYSMQEEPFLHIDGDVFLWQKPDDNFLSAQIISQNIEKNLPFYKPTLDEINEKLQFIPPAFKKETYDGKNIYASNAGLIGGNDLSFFRMYCNEAFEFIEKNTNELARLQTLPNINFIFEQYALFQLAQRENKTITYYVDKIIETPLYEDFVRFQNLPLVKLIHPVAGFKKQLYVCDFVAKYLRYAYPDYYYNIINTLIKANVEISCKAYTNTKLCIPEVLTVQNASDIMHEIFQRTSAAIVKWTSLKITSDENWFLNIDAENFKNLISDVVDDETKKEILREIFTLEKSIFHVYNNVLGDKLNEAIYTEDVFLYKRYLHVFSLERDSLLLAKIRLSKYPVFLDMHWAWEYDSQEQINNLLETNLAKPKAEYRIVLIPNVIRNTVVEYYIDELDTIIIEIIKELQNSTIALLLDSLKEFFDKEEIEENPDSYETLIISSIKRLSYAGVLETFLE